MWNKIKDTVGPSFLLAVCVICSTVIAVAAMRYMPDAIQAWNGSVCENCECGE